jgi:hypothetical protein
MDLFAPVLKDVIFMTPDTAVSHARYDENLLNTAAMNTTASLPPTLPAKPSG